MSYVSIMVQEDLEAKADARLAIAAELAKRFNARLTGIAACVVEPPAYGQGSLAVAIVNQLRPQTEKQMKEAADRFRAAAQGHARELEWRQAFAPPTKYVAQEARSADLIVTGAVRNRNYLDPLTDLDPAALILQAGRPVIVVPPEPNRLSGKHVVVAWKDTREARRAVCDALPLLQAAEDVTIVEIADRATLSIARTAAEDVVAWLNQHGVCAGANPIVSANESFDALEAVLEQNAADLVIAGAYGHSRVSEWVFGGFTRDLLTKARCCCLFSN
jgi:nucleotide-binding universal stress UspA family protein